MNEWQRESMNEWQQESMNEWQRESMKDESTTGSRSMQFPTPPVGGALSLSADNGTLMDRPQPPPRPPNPPPPVLLQPLFNLSNTQ